MHGAAGAGVTGRVLVTGATGFVGRHAAQALAAAGFAVRRAARRPDADWRAGEDCLVGDLRGEVDWSAALADVATVVHAAASVHRPGEDPTVTRLVNVEATRRLAEAALRAGVRRFVFLGSAGVHGDDGGPAPVDEASPTRPGTPYAASKLEAEAVLARLAQTTGMEVAMLRPPMVYGPGNPGNLPRLMRLIATGLPLPFGAVRNRRSFIAVGNLSDAIVRCCAADRLAGVFLVSDGETCSTPDLVRLLAQGLGRAPRLAPVPVAWLAVLGRLLGRSADVRRLTSSFVIRDDALRAALGGWHPPVATREALVATGRWFAADGGRERS